MAGAVCMIEIVSDIGALVADVVDDMSAQGVVAVEMVVVDCLVVDGTEHMCVVES